MYQLEKKHFDKQNDLHQQQNQFSLVKPSSSITRTVTERLCTGRIWDFPMLSFIRWKGMVLCNETGKLSERDRLRLYMWHGEGKRARLILMRAKV